MTSELHHSPRKERAQIAQQTTIEGGRKIGEADSNPEETGDPRVERDTPGRPQEEETYVTLPNLAGEVLREQR